MAVDVDLSRIRSYQGSQDCAFEELVCQLARRYRPQNGSEFRRVEGAGGDGGVEAYWLCADGTKIAYQAKYFLRSREIGWAQVAHSFSSAIKNHPELKTYFVALACDLTPVGERAGKPRKGAWGYWEDFKEKGEVEASNRGMRVEIHLLCKSDIVDRLTVSSAAALREYWFNEPFFGRDWFEKNFQVTRADLGERYCPEDHVEVQCVESLEGLVRSEVFIDKVLKLIHQVPGIRQKMTVDFDSEDLRKLVEEVERALRDIEKLEPAFKSLNCEELPIEQLRNSTTLVRSIIQEIIQSTVSGKTATALSRERVSIMSAQERFYGLSAFLYEVGFSAFSKKALAVVGPAGSGKSHLLASFVEREIRKGMPAVMLLGQYFVSSSLGETFKSRLDTGQQFSLETLLGVLNVAAECSRGRGLIVVDAINEACEIQIVKSEILGFLERVGGFEHLVVVVSTRDEYMDYFFPGKSRDRLTWANCSGFTTPDEAEAAAIKFIDGRGIRRPTMPWLFPEFTNPLFLKTCCDALKRSGKSEFPRGIRGAHNVLTYYLDSLQNKLNSKYQSLSSTVVDRIVAAIGYEMGHKRRGFLMSEELESLTREVLGNLEPLTPDLFVKELCEEGLLRVEHRGLSDAPRHVSPTKIYRLTYQRFSDHLMTESLIGEREEITEAFSPGGDLSFLLTDSSWNRNYSNLLESFCVQVPERFSGVELPDILECHLEAHQWYQVLSNPFSESLRWRDSRAFTASTLKWFNKICSDRVDVIAELSIISGHAWNIDFFHHRLLKMRMADRDAVWSNPIALGRRPPRISSLKRLIDWACTYSLENLDRHTLRLCAITMCWTLTTSHRQLRDTATKVLSVIILQRPGLFLLVLRAFKECDDLYVLERILAACLGAVPHVDDEHMKKFACETYSLVFRDGAPPRHVLIRDYALGIIEFVASRKLLSCDVEIKRCRPPYERSWPIEDVMIDDIERLASEAGGNGISLSCLSDEDFSRYEIEPHFKDFSSTPLTSRKPVNQRASLDAFEAEIVGWKEEQVRAVKRLKKASRDLRTQQLLNDVAYMRGDSSAAGEESARSLARGLLEREKELLSLLTPKQQGKYRNLAKKCLGATESYAHDEIARFGTQRAARYIARRAYEMGWTRERFSREYHSPGRERPTIERIGKKYQWLAFYELMARLCDSVWLVRGGEEVAFRYSGIHQLGIVRDVEPTILPASATSYESMSGTPWWFVKVVPSFGKSVSDEDLLQWTFLDEGIENSLDAIDGLDNDKWLQLYGHTRLYEHHPNKQVDRYSRRYAWLRLASVVVKKCDLQYVLSRLHALQKKDPLLVWDTPSMTDEAYYGEYPWRRTWHEILSNWQFDDFGVLEGFQYKNTVVRHVWEHHLDLSLSAGNRVCLPAHWLLDACRLRVTREPGKFCSEDANVRFWDPSVGTEFHSSGLIDREAFLECLERRRWVCLWLVSGERRASPDGSQKHWAQRTHSTIHWLTDGKWQKQCAVQDSQRGLDSELPYVKNMDFG